MAEPLSSSIGSVLLQSRLPRSSISNGGKAWARELDVCDYSALQVIVDEAVANTGCLDYMFNNVGIGIGIGGLAEDYELEDWDITIGVNLRGVTNGIQVCYRLSWDLRFNSAKKDLARVLRLTQRR